MGYRGEQLLLVTVKSGDYQGQQMQVYNYVGPLYGGPLHAGDRATILARADKAQANIPKKKVRQTVIDPDTEKKTSKLTFEDKKKPPSKVSQGVREAPVHLVYIEDVAKRFSDYMEMAGVREKTCQIMNGLLGLGLMLSAGEIPRIAGAFGLDTTTRANIMSAVYTAQAAVSTTKIGRAHV